MITSAMNKRKENSRDHGKYIDDLSVGEAILLKDTLVKVDDNTIVRPHTFPDRFKLLLPEKASMIQKQLTTLEGHAVKKRKKTKNMLFDTAKTKDFSPKLKIQNDIV